MQTGYVLTVYDMAPLSSAHKTRDYYAHAYLVHTIHITLIAYQVYTQ